MARSTGKKDKDKASASCPSVASLKKKEKKIRDELSEKQVDRMIEGSFPASDPPGTY